MNELSSRRGFLRAALGTGVVAGSWAGTGGAGRTSTTTYARNAVATNSNWPMFQHDAANSGTLSTTGPSEPVEAVWTFETDGSLVAQPIVKNGTVFQASKDSNVYAVSADTGEEEWSVGTNRSLIRTPAVANSIVYVPTQTGRVLGLSVGTGSGQWLNATEAKNPGALTLTGDSVLFIDRGYEANHVYNLDAATGDQRWRFNSNLYETVTPILSEGRIYIYGGDAGRNAVVARALSDRSKVWQNAASSGSYVNLNNANALTYADYDGGTIFVGDGAGVVASLSAADGSRNWRFSNLGTVNTTPTFADGTLYVTTEEPALYAIDPSIGTERWRVGLNGSPTSPVVVDGMVYLGCGDNSVYGFDAQSSEQRWRFETGNSVVVPPAVLDGTVYVASTDGTLYALREEGAISPGDVTGDGAPARDLDQDGLYEDVNGDGAFTIVDVHALFANLESDVIQNNVSKFDFNGDGTVDVTDVQALYARLNE